MRIVIVSGGHIEDAFAVKWIKEHQYEYMIAVDRGMEFFHRNGLTPDLIVGDFDSVSSKVLDFYRGSTETQMITLNPIKDDTDTEFAIHKAIEKGATTITLLGATGSRLDHVLANMELLGITFRHDRGDGTRVEMDIIDSHNRIYMTDQSIELKKDRQFGKYVSLIPVTMEVKGLTLIGFKYPLYNHTLKKFTSLGISNEITESVAAIAFKEGILLVIESRD
jgi:thiamine pyrophosphokinase